MARPRKRVRSASQSLLVSCPSIKICPPLGWSSRPIRLSSVVFPEPDDPISAVNSPRRSLRSMPCKTSVSNGVPDNIGTDRLPSRRNDVPARYDGLHQAAAHRFIRFNRLAENEITRSEAKYRQGQHAQQRQLEPSLAGGYWGVDWSHVINQWVREDQTFSIDYHRLDMGITQISLFCILTQ